ncbi:MAG: iron-sulfur cluster assembly protein [Thermoplasmata archaeon]|nr:iron-sulfur cluster assembly protein [Thermoplasmata archaeon]TFG70243.1 MAG: DUF59 domain-containing protein [Methanomassiliicoccus sp.]
MTTEDEVISTLREIVDPHTNINIFDMGLISDITVKGDSISLVFRPTSPFCPLGIHLAMNIKRRLIQMPNIKNANVKIVGHVQEDMINSALLDSP